MKFAGFINRGRWTLFCSDCSEVFQSSPLANAWCEKCGEAHILCPACWDVHKLSASEQDRYLNQLEAK